MAGSISAAQLYGNTNPRFKNPAIPASDSASSPLMGTDDALYYWLAFVGLLVLLRVLYYYAEET